MEYRASEHELIQKYLKYIGLTNALLSIVALFIASYLWKYIKKIWVRQMRFFEVAATLPGPPAIPLLGNILMMNQNVEDTLNVMRRMAEEYKPRFRFWMGPKLFIFTMDPNDVKIILSSQHTTLKGDIYRAWEPLVGDSIIITADPNYKLRRKAILATMNSKTLTSFIDIYDRHSEKCASALENELGAGEFDVKPFLLRCVNDIVTEAVLSTSLANRKEVAEGILETHHRIYELLYKKMMSICYRADFIFFNTKIGGECRKALNLLRGFVQDAITDQRRERSTLSDDAITAEEQKLGVMKQMVDWFEEKKLVSEKVLLDDMTTVFAAALDPITEISSFVLHMLALHQDVQDKVREEVVEVVGKGRVEASYLQDLKYLDMVIKETIRLFPIATMITRKVTADVELDSCCLPEGSMVIVFAFMLHRNPEHWLRPEEFIPERFLPENSAKRHPHAYIPFSHGSRSCVGQKFAMLSLKTIVANLVRRFRFEANGRLEDLELRTDITVRPRNGHRLSISRV